MAKRKTTKKPVEPVIEYVDPETNLDTPEVEVEKAPESVVQSPNEFFRCMKRRRDKEK